MDIIAVFTRVGDIFELLHVHIVMFDPPNIPFLTRQPENLESQPETQSSVAL